MYKPLSPAEIPVTLFVRMRADSAEGFVERLREITTALDPSLQLTRVLPLDGVYRQEQSAWHWGAAAFSLVTLSVLLLSAAGIYALMAFTVTRRRKEIGIRVALGADRRQILQSIFSRALIQLAMGVALGAAAAVGIDIATDGEMMGARAAIVLPAVSTFMMAIGLLAAAGPARRGLRINPTEALKQE